MPAGLEVGILAKMSDNGHGILGTLCRSSSCRSWGGCGCERRKNTRGGNVMVVDHGTGAGSGGDHLIIMLVLLLHAATGSPTALLGNLPRDGGRDDFLVDRCTHGLERWLAWFSRRFWIVQLIEVPLAHTIGIALRLPVAIGHLALLGLGPVFLAGALRLDNLAAAGEAAQTLRLRRLVLGTRRCGPSGIWSPLRSSIDGFDGRGCSLGSSIAVGCVKRYLESEHIVSKAKNRTVEMIFIMHVS